MKTRCWGPRRSSRNTASSLNWPRPTPEPEAVEVFETGVEQETLRKIAQTITTVPRGFNLNPKIVGLLARRAKMVEGSVAVDWATAEALAFGSVLMEGASVRLTGQDTVRGTFSQRHAAFADTITGEEWTPLATLATGQARFQIYDSPLSETGALGFEYGYSVADLSALVLWEAQFGDFINAAQVIVDQFIASGEEKWNQTSAIRAVAAARIRGAGAGAFERARRTVLAALRRAEYAGGQLHHGRAVFPPACGARSNSPRASRW